MNDQHPTALPPYPDRDDEISLYDLWNTLRRHRGLIGLIWLLVIGGTLVYALIRTPVYLLEGVIEVGDMPDLAAEEMVLIESTASLESRVNEIIIPRVLDEQAETPSLPTPRAEVLSEDSGLMRLVLEIPAEQADEGTALLERIATAIIDRHAERVDTRRERLETHLIEIEADLTKALGRGDAARGGERAGERADEARSNDIGEASQILSLLMEQLIDREHHDDANLRDTANLLRGLISATDNTEVARAPTLAETPEGQPMTTLLGLGAVLGLMLGVFAAFGREFMKNAAAERDNAAG